MNTGQLHLSPAADFKQFRPGERGLRILRHCFPRHSDFYPKTRIHKWLSKKCRSLSKRCKSNNRSASYYSSNRRPTCAERKAAMKRCALCHGRLGLGARFRNIWNGRWVGSYSVLFGSLRRQTQNLRCRYLDTEGAGSGPNDADLWHGGRVVAVEQDRQSTQTRNDLAQQLEPLAGEIDILGRQASKIAAGPRQTSESRSPSLQCEFARSNMSRSRQP
jgi:hypothetical protein